MLLTVKKADDAQEIDAALGKLALKENKSKKNDKRAPKKEKSYPYGFVRCTLSSMRGIAT